MNKFFDKLKNRYHRFKSLFNGSLYKLKDKLEDKWKKINKANILVLLIGILYSSNLYRADKYIMMAENRRSLCHRNLLLFYYFLGCISPYYTLFNLLKVI